MDWYRIRITHTELMQGKTERLVGEVQDLFRSNGPDPALAVYSSPVSDQAIDLYFSPAAAALATSVILKYWGIQSAPAPSTAKLIFGTQQTHMSSLGDSAKTKET